MNCGHGWKNEIDCDVCRPPAVMVAGLRGRISDLEAALRPFADLYDRMWADREDMERTARAGGYACELQAINLADVLRARDLLHMNTETDDA
ncbi:MAG: hypothetical protein E6Q97_14655 [Desulfurellales bacterium]|nr:MAG: hypothetical protein E6Q97_14655 [Desulfurellales bacterium]